MNEKRKRIIRHNRKYWLIDAADFWEWAQQNQDKIMFNNIEKMPFLLKKLKNFLNGTDRD
jgi:hypothetical protein